MSALMGATIPIRRLCLAGGGRLHYTLWL